MNRATFILSRGCFFIANICIFNINTLNKFTRIANNIILYKKYDVISESEKEHNDFETFIGCDNLLFVFRFMYMQIYMKG